MTDATKSDRLKVPLLFKAAVAAGDPEGALNTLLKGLEDTMPKPGSESTTMLYNFSTNPQQQDLDSHRSPVVF